MYYRDITKPSPLSSDEIDLPHFTETKPDPFEKYLRWTEPVAEAAVAACYRKTRRPYEP